MTDAPIPNDEIDDAYKAYTYTIGDVKKKTIAQLIRDAYFAGAAQGVEFTKRIVFEEIEK